MTITEVFELDSFSRMFRSAGLIDEIDCDEEGNISLKMPVCEQNMNGNGKCQGGAIFTLADVTAGAYCRLHGMKPATIDAAIRFYNAGEPGRMLHSQVFPRKVGNTITTLAVTVKDDQDLLIADFTANMMKFGGR